MGRLIEFDNFLATVRSWFKNENTAERTYTFPDRSGQVALDDLQTSSIAGTSNLTASAFGKLHICTGTTSDYTVTLPDPSGNEGKSIAFKGSSALTKVVTIAQNASETIDGEASRKMAATGLIVLYCDGTNWFVVNEVGSAIPWTPTWPTHSGIPTHETYYFRQGKKVTVVMYMSGNNTSNATTFSITGFPLNFKANILQYGSCNVIVDNGVTQLTIGIIRTSLSNQNQINILKDTSATAFTASGTKRTDFVLTALID